MNRVKDNITSLGSHAISCKGLARATLALLFLCGFCQITNGQIFKAKTPLLDKSVLVYDYDDDRMDVVFKDLIQGKNEKALNGLHALNAEATKSRDLCLRAEYLNLSTKLDVILYKLLEKDKVIERSAERTIQSFQLADKCGNKRLMNHNQAVMNGLLVQITNTRRRESLRNKFEAGLTRIAKKEAIVNASEKMASLSEQNQDLKAILENREEAIRDMTSEQLKGELMMMKQLYIIDSLQHSKDMDSLKILNQQNALTEQEAELEAESAQKNLYLALMAFALLTALGVFFTYFKTRALNKQIRQEKQKSEDLLLNILPKQIAEELKKRGVSSPIHFSEASVMFCDFVGFSRIAADMSPTELVEELNQCFAGFDMLCKKYGLEKIKTIGDAYMCAGGVPEFQPDFIQNTLLCAMEMIDFLKKREEEGKRLSKARIGIHVGEVVAGVVGTSKFAYDIWGDTVNVAARLESSGESSQINVSEEVRLKTIDDFHFRDRGDIEVKNIGTVHMHFLEWPNGH